MGFYLRIMKKQKIKESKNEEENKEEFFERVVKIDENLSAFWVSCLFMSIFGLIGSIIFIVVCLSSISLIGLGIFISGFFLSILRILEASKIYWRKIPS